MPSFLVNGQDNIGLPAFAQDVPCSDGKSVQDYVNTIGDVSAVSVTGDTIADKLTTLNDSLDELATRSLDYSKYTLITNNTYTPSQDGLFVVQSGTSTSASCLVKYGEFELARANGNGTFRGTANVSAFKDITYTLSWAGGGEAAYFIPYK